MRWVKKLLPAVSLVTAISLLASFLFVIVPGPVPVKADSWWNDSWSKRIKITFDHSSVATNVTSFPVGIHLDTGISGFSWSDVQDDGDDVRFLDSNDSTQLPYEIELWDDGNDAWLWVQVPQIDGGSDTDYIYMYYGNASVSAGEDAESVWDSDYVAVYHFSEASGTIYDSTSYSNDSTASNNITYSQTGQFGNHVLIGTSGYLDLSDDTDLEFNADDELSIECLVKVNPSAGSVAIFSKHDDGDADNEYWFGIESDNSFGTLLDNDGSGWATTTSTRQSGVGGGALSDNTWYGLATTVSSSNIYEWVNGAAANPNASYAYSSGIYAGDAIAVIGANQDHAGTLNGYLDELRVSKVQRSADWVEATYLSITEASQSYAAAESSPSVSVTTNSPTFGATTATLSGTLNGLGGEATVYCFFSWGTTPSLGTNTTEQAKGSTGNFSQGLTGLTEGQTYYYRAVARYDTGSYTVGSTLSFTTSSTENWLGTYTYRQELSVAKTTTRTNFPVAFTVHKGTGTTTDDDIYLANGALSWPGDTPNDIRFTDDDGTTELDYWIQDGANGTTEAVVWVEIPTVDSDGETFYIYYGKSGDTTTSDIEETFTFGEDFEDFSTGALVGQDGWAEFNGGASGDIVVEDSSGDRGVTTDFGGNAHHAVAIDPSDGYAVMVYVKRTGGDQAFWVYLKSSATGESISSSAIEGYNYAWGAGTNTFCRLAEGDGTNTNWLTSEVSQSMATGDYHLLEAQWYGTTTLKGFDNGSEKLDGSDATYSSSSYIGLATGRNSGTEYFIAWIAVRAYDAEEISYTGSAPGGTGVPVMITGSYTGVSETSVTLWGQLVSTNTTATERGFDYGGAYEDSRLVVFPDIQGMIDNPDWYYYLENDVDWIIANQSTYNIEAVLFEGDLTNYGYLGLDSTKAQDEWDRVDALLDDLLDAGIVCLVVPGNHDYIFTPPPSGYPDVSDRDLTMYNLHVGPDRFSSYSWWQGDMNGNSAVTFDMGGVPYMAIGLQFGPTDADLAWADSVIDSNPDRLFIIVTHGYMDDDNTRLGATDAHSSSYYFTDGSDNNGEEIWSELVSQHPNIVMVLSGHVTTGDGQGRRVDYVGGEPVEQILTNYQTYTDGGEGYMAMFDLQPDANTVYRTTYSVDAGSRTASPDQYQFAFRADGSKYEPFAFSTTTTSTSFPLGTYSLSITGLNPSVTYEYRAKALNSVGWGYGSTKTFQTQGAPTTPGAPTGLSAQSTSSQITVSWTKGSSADNTLVRYATSGYPTTISSGTQLYFGTGTSSVFSTASPGVTYYFSAWSESGGVYSLTYATTTAALGTTGTLPNPNVFQIESVKVFSNYLTNGDLLIVVNTKVLMEALPAEDISDCVVIQLLDGTLLKAQGTPTQWGFRPASIYLGPGHGLVWGSEYTIKLLGRSNKWTSQPSTTFTFGAGTWSGSNLDYLANWVIDSADRIGEYYGIDLTAYVPGKQREVLTTQGGQWFSEAIPGLRDTRPDLFGSGVVELDNLVPDAEEAVYGGQGETFEDVWGEEITQQLEELGSFANLSGPMMGAVIWVGTTFIIAGGIALLTGPGVAMVAVLPFFWAGTEVRVIDISVAIALSIIIVLAALFKWIIKT